nr:YlmH/Sll1252 family protein [Streptococcus cuniculipharyngis]
METSYSYQLTDFLDPRQLTIASNILASQGVSYFLSTALCPMEQARLIIAPDYYVYHAEDFEISLVEIDYPRKFSQLTHRQVMGAFLNQSGLKRGFLGDILVADGRIQCFIDSRKLPYLAQEVTSIGRLPVSLREIAFEERLVGESGQERFIISSSLRLDKVVAQVLKKPRSQVLALIEQGRVKCDHALVDKPSLELAIGSLVSIRGYGRFQIEKSKGLSKQGKYKLIIRQMMSK